MSCFLSGLTAAARKPPSHWPPHRPCPRRRLASEDPIAEVPANYPDAKADEAKAAETWRRNWDRCFGRFVAETK